jgi:hypothetical protein
MDTTRLLVPLVDVGGAAGTTSSHAAHWAKKLGIKVAEDWAGRSGVEHADARRIVAAITEAQRTAAQLQSAYELYEADWRRRQHAAGEAAFSDYIEQSLEVQRRSPPSSDYAYYGGRLATPVGPRLTRGEPGSRAGALL